MSSWVKMTLLWLVKHQLLQKLANINNGEIQII